MDEHMENFCRTGNKVALFGWTVILIMAFLVAALNQLFPEHPEPQREEGKDEWSVLVDDLSPEQQRQLEADGKRRADAMLNRLRSQELGDY